jgi:hypothetical protein
MRLAMSVKEDLKPVNDIKEAKETKAKAPEIAEPVKDAGKLFNADESYESDDFGKTAAVKKVKPQRTSKAVRRKTHKKKK